MRRTVVAIAVVVLISACTATEEPSGYTESLAFNGKTEQSAPELQARLDAMHERFGIDPGSTADKDTEWLLLSVSDTWVTVDKLLACIDESDGVEMVAVATNCAAGLEAEATEWRGE